MINANIRSRNYTHGRGGWESLSRRCVWCARHQNCRLHRPERDRTMEYFLSCGKRRSLEEQKQTASAALDKYEKEIPRPRQTRIGLLCKQHAATAPQRGLNCWRVWQSMTGRWIRCKLSGLCQIYIASSPPAGDLNERVNARAAVKQAPKSAVTWTWQWRIYSHLESWYLHF